MVIDWVPYLAWTLCALLLLIGFLGAFLPVFPGLPLMALGVLIHKLLLPGVLSWWTVAVFIATAILALGLDLAATAYTAKWAGAGRVGVIGAVVGGIVGLFFALPGIILGPFIGAFLAEWAISKQDVTKALKSAAGAALGLLVGGLGKGLLGFFLIVWFLMDAFVL